ncbi:MAG: histidine phosphatase family protein [Alphaproteobacteria bacterium]
MKVLYLLRHAKSSGQRPGSKDYDRPLTDEGRDGASKLGRRMRSRGFIPERILCSGALRARETLDLIAAGLGKDIPAEIDRRLYAANAEQLLRRLQKLDETIGSVLVIGHNPTLQSLAADLAGAGKRAGKRKDIERLGVEFPAASLAVFTISGSSWQDLGPGVAALKALVRPKDLA